MSNDQKHLIFNPENGLSLYSLIEISEPIQKKGVLFDFISTKGENFRFQLYVTQNYEIGIWVEDNQKTTFTITKKSKNYFNKPILLNADIKKEGNNNFIATVSINNEEKLKEHFPANIQGDNTLLATIGTDHEKQSYAKFVLGEVILYGSAHNKEEKIKLWEYFRNKWLNTDGEDVNNG